MTLLYRLVLAEYVSQKVLHYAVEIVSLEKLLGYENRIETLVERIEVYSAFGCITAVDNIC